MLEHEIYYLPTEHIPSQAGVSEAHGPVHLLLAQLQYYLNVYNICIHMYVYVVHTC